MSPSKCCIKRDVTNFSTLSKWVFLNKTVNIFLPYLYRLIRAKQYGVISCGKCSIAFFANKSLMSSTFTIFSKSGARAVRAFVYSFTMVILVSEGICFVS